MILYLHHSVLASSIYCNISLLSAQFTSHSYTNTHTDDTRNEALCSLNRPVARVIFLNWGLGGMWWGGEGWMGGEYRLMSVVGWGLDMGKGA